MAYVSEMPEPIAGPQPLTEPEQIVEDVLKEVEEKAKPEPEQKPKTFKCKKCQKEFPEENKLRRHIGMSHYKDLEI